jgi:hypothetical protein
MFAFLLLLNPRVHACTVTKKNGFQVNIKNDVKSFDPFNWLMHSGAHAFPDLLSGTIRVTVYMCFYEIVRAIRPGSFVGSVFRDAGNNKLIS